MKSDGFYVSFVELKESEILTRVSPGLCREDKTMEENVWRRNKVIGFVLI